MKPTDTERVEHDEAVRKLDEENMAKAYEACFSTVDGRRVLNDILEFCRVFTTTFTGNNRTFFLEGQRNTGLYIIGKFSHMRLAQLMEVRQG